MAILKTAVPPALLGVLVLGLVACGGEPEEVTLTDKQKEEVAARIAPEGEVVLASEVVAQAPPVSAAGAGEPRDPQEIYDRSCTTCHTTGAAGAPRLGDAAAWAERIAQGMDVLYRHAIEGIRGMPPRGLCMDCSDDEIRAVVDFMVERSR
ncbi:MAG: cytochrome c [Porticoccaceae bacterium]|nr:MAG: cytochrome c [Porticoccaceae bacterium]